MTQCPDDETLVALVENALTAARLDELEAHVDSCASCRRVVASLAQVHALGSAPNAATVELELEPGAIAGERYRIERQLGRGGMGIVYLARDLTLARHVAVKVHRAPAGHERLYQEAVALARLAHPNVVSVFEVGMIGTHRFVAMEYVRGCTARAWLATPRTWREIVALFAQVGDGLAAAHRAGLVHRDFKPENVLVGEDGRPRVVDFGLVLARDDAAGVMAPDAPATSVKTETGAAVGTPAYMAPEQLVAGPLDERCDQFAFCVTVWEALFGKRPFAGATMAALQEAISRNELRAVSRNDVPVAVRRILERGLAARAADRFVDMGELTAALRRAARPRRWPWLAAAVGVIALAAGGLAVRAAVIEHARLASCDSDADHVRGLLAPTRQAAVQTAFSATRSTLATSAFDHAAAVLGPYSERLATRIAAACRADEPARVSDARGRCLRDRAAELARLVDALGHPDPAAVQGAAQAAWSLAQRAPCDDTRALLAEPATTEVAHEPDALNDARTRLALGQYDVGIVELAPIVALARTRGDRDAELAALDELAQLNDGAGAIADAKAELHREVELAETLGRDTRAGFALARLASIADDPDRDFTEAHRDITLARAKLARLGGDNRALEATIALAEGRILISEARFTDAETLLRRGIALDQETFGPDHPNVARAFTALNEALAGEGRHGDALVAAQHACELFEHALGDDHPSVANALTASAHELVALGRNEDARAELARADAIYRHTLAADHPSRARLINELAIIEVQEHHDAAAIADYREYLQLVEKIDGPESADAGDARRCLGDGLERAGQHAGALVEYRESLDVLEHALGNDDTVLAEPLEGIARSLVALDRKAEAVAHAERALALITAHPGYDTARAASLQFVLAGALWSTGQRTRARALAETANTAELDATDHAEIVAWLATHGR